MQESRSGICVADTIESIPLRINPPTGPRKGHGVIARFDVKHLPPGCIFQHVKGKWVAQDGVERDIDFTECWRVKMNGKNKTCQQGDDAFLLPGDACDYDGRVEFTAKA